jgi:phage tail sheath protein FI
MPTYATPGVYFERVDNATQVVQPLRTDIAGFVGIAQKGPVHKATLVESWKQFQATFGSFISNGYLAYSAKAFFDNGGQSLYVVRVAAPKTSTATTGAQPANGMSSVVLSVAGFAKGALATLQQSVAANAVGAQPADRKSSIVNTVAGFLPGSVVQVAQAPSLQAWHKIKSIDVIANRIYWEVALESSFLLAPPITFTNFNHDDRLVGEVDASTNTLTWAESIAPEFDVTHPIQVDTGRSKSHGTFYDANGLPTIEVKAVNPGAWGDSIQVSVSHSSLAATATSAVAQPPSGNYSYVQSVVGFPKYSLVKIYQTHSPTPIIDYRTVTLVDPTTNMLQWDSPLPASLDFTHPTTKPINFETVEFALTVYVNSSPKEIFIGLSMKSSHPRYFEKVVNPQKSADDLRKQIQLPSQYIRVRDLHSLLSGSNPPANLPDPSAPQLADGVLDLWGGRDGIAALQMIDFTGDAGSDKKWGIRSMEDVDEISIVAVPDILIEPAPPVAYLPLPKPQPDPCLPSATAPQIAPPPLPPPTEAAPSFTLDQVYQVQQALLQHCQLMQFRFAILDPPDFAFPKLHVDLGEVQSWRQRFTTMYAALYYPWILVRDPLQLENSVVRRVPPSGHIAGVYANTDLTVGVHKAPANTELQWAQDLTTDVTSEMQGFLNPIDVDCIRSFSGRGLRVYGARTLSDLASWRFINVRRLFFMIEHALLISMQWAVFEPNDVHLWNLLRTSISGILEAQWRKGAFAGNTAEESFYVKCDQTNNSQATTAAGQLFVEIGIAPALPAEFVVFRIGQVGDTLEVTE